MKWNLSALLTIILVVGCASVAMADPLCAGTVATIGNPCDIGNLVFNNLTAVSTANPSGIAIPSSSIGVAPDLTPGDYGLEIFPGMSVNSAAGASFQDIALSFNVTTNDGSLITGIDLVGNPFASGTGTASVTEYWCVGHVLLGCPTGDGGSFTVTNQSFSQLVTFNTPGAIVYVSQDNNVSTGLNGMATLSTDDKTFTTSAVPEPASMALVGMGLLGLGLIHRRRQQKRE